jgi:hypothetical protein
MLPVQSSCSLPALQPDPGGETVRAMKSHLDNAQGNAPGAPRRLPRLVALVDMSPVMSLCLAGARAGSCFPHHRHGADDAAQVA